jgi:hypothetical protein
MTGLPIGELAPRAHFITDAPRGDRTASTFVSSSVTSSESLSDDQKGQLENLQRLVCELLFKNQQLRMALMEARSNAGSKGVHHGMT